VTKLDDAIAATIHDAHRLEDDIDDLVELLRAGAGSPIAGELTPEEAREVATHVGNVGLAGMRLLAGDLYKTAEREGAVDELPEEFKPRLVPRDPVH
jgi:hypothetical protein